MEARAEYSGRVERPRLIVVRDDGEQARFSALPHGVLFDRRLTDGEVRMFAVLQSHWFGPTGECTASHATLAAEMDKKERTVRALLKGLEDKGVIASRHLGRGQAKAYRCADVTSGRNLPVESGEYRPVETPKRQKSASQAAKNSQFKRQKSAAPIEEDSGKKTLEEELPPTEVGAAVAADQPAKEPKAKKSGDKRTRCPDTFPLEAKHFDYGETLGMDRTRVSAETVKFLDYHRFKGTLGLDWYAGWQNWMRKAVEYGTSRSAPGQRNGAASPTPPTRDVVAAWAGWNGRHGSNLDGKTKRDDGR